MDKPQTYKVIGFLCIIFGLIFSWINWQMIVLLLFVPLGLIIMLLADMLDFLIEKIK